MSSGGSSACHPSRRLQLPGLGVPPQLPWLQVGPTRSTLTAARPGLGLGRGSSGAWWSSVAAPMGRSKPGPHCLQPRSQKLGEHLMPISPPGTRLSHCREQLGRLVATPTVMPTGEESPASDEGSGRQHPASSRDTSVMPGLLRPGSPYSAL